MAIPPLRPSGNLRRQRTRSFEIAISGLLTRRVELLHEGGRQDDIAALDRSLGLLGYEGDIEAVMPAKQPPRVYKNGGLRLACLAVLEAADRPLTSREIAAQVYPDRGKDYVAGIYRIAKCLRADREAGCVVARQYSGRALVWMMSKRSS